MAEYSSNLLINPYADEPVTTGWTASNNAEVISGGYLGAAFRLNSPAYLEQVIPVDTFGEDTKGIQLSCRARFTNSGPALYAEIVLYLRLQITNADGTTAFFMPCQTIIMPGVSTWILFEKGFEERISGITEVVFRAYSINENVVVDLDNISVAIDETRTESEQAFDGAVDYTNLGIEAHLNDITNSHLSDEQKYGLTGGAQRVRSIKLGMETNVRIANRNLYGQLPVVKLEAIREQTPVITPLFWTELLVKTIANVTSTSVAVQYDENGIGKVFVAYVADSTLYIRAAQFSYPISEMIWEDVEEIPGCSQCALDFDGRFTRNGTIIEFLTDDLPWLFYTTTSGELKGGILGSPYESLVGANVTAIDAVRGVASKYKDIDQGLLVFYVIAGNLYYRDLIAGVWGDQTSVSIAPADIVSVRAERTFDYRIVLQVTDTSGALHEIFTKMEASGWNGTDYATKLSTVTLSIIPTLITYLDAKNDDVAVTASAVALDTWNMSIYSPVLLRAWNVPISLETPYDPYDDDLDYGYCVIFEFDQIVRNAELFPSDFMIEDDAGSKWYGQEVYLNNRFVTVYFGNFNNAENSITAKALAGNLTNGYTFLTETSVQFNATGLIPVFVPSPVPVSIENIQDWSGSL